MSEVKLLLGDCLELMKDIPDGSIDAVITSPPYNLGIDYGIYKDNLTVEEYYTWCGRWIKEIYRTLAPSGRFMLNHYLSCGTSKKRFAPLMELNHIACELGFNHHGIAIWDDRTISKRTAWGSWLSASAPYINSPYEGILVLYKGEWHKGKGVSTIEKDEFMETASGVWKMATERNRETPAPYPIKLPTRCINFLTFKDDVILDLFMGSGTTGVACVQTNRNFIGMEIEPKYFEIAQKRIHDAQQQMRLPI